MPRRLLVLAYYFPPMGGSGVQRIAKFAKYLPDHGWQPTVLTVAPGGYFAYDPGLLAEVEAAGVEVVQTRSFDPTQLFGRARTVALPAEPARRRLSHLSQWLFVPDNKVGWLPFAVAEGLRLHRAAPFDALLSTAPPYTAHLAAALLSRLTRLPLVLDFRDDWVGNPRHHYPTPFHAYLNAALEGFALRQARRVCVINAPIQAQMARRHPDLPPPEVLPQGFDPADFEGVEAAPSAGRFRLTYTGMFYDAQTPDVLLEAVHRLMRRRADVAETIELVFAGLLPEASRRRAEALGLGSRLRYLGYLPHGEIPALQRGSTALWLTVGERAGAEGISTGKLFEYLGARRPILALVPEGDVRAVLADHPAAWMAPPGCVEGVERALESLFEAWQQERLPAVPAAWAARYDRRRLTGLLARYLEEATEPLLQ